MENKTISFYSVYEKTKVDIDVDRIKYKTYVKKGGRGLSYQLIAEQDDGKKLYKFTKEETAKQFPEIKEKTKKKTKTKTRKKKKSQK